MERRRPGERRPDDRRDPRFDGRGGDPRNPGGIRRSGPASVGIQITPVLPFGKPDLPPPPPKPERVPDPIAEPGTSSVREEEALQAQMRDEALQRRRDAVQQAPIARRKNKKPAHEPKLALKQICRIVHVDDDLVVVDKMPGVPVVPSRGFHRRSVLHALHQMGYPVVYPISMLDMEASGLVVFSRSEAAAQALRWNWRSRLCERQFVAVAQGDLPGSHGKIAVATGAVRDGNAVRHQALPVESGGKTGTTEWKLLARGRGMTRVLCTLKSGRCHQIRIHFAAIGFPLVGDKVYGAVHNEVPLEVLIEAPGKYADAPHMAHGTVALHCFRIQIPHPTTQQPMDWQAPVPRRITALMPGAWTVHGIGKD
ncbi:MAG: RluA family pseudouridine synthase [Deltaproteobacteria bacterium]|nr:RluA family pseudouridine synthase [Deltaproteobacteria bacterium]